MDNLRKEQVNTFIKNAGKSRQTPLIHYDAFSGKPKGELDLTWEDVFYIVASMMIIGFITYLVLEG